MANYYFYSIQDILGFVAGNKDIASSERLIKVKTQPFASNGFRNDTFVIEKTESLLDLNSDEDREMLIPIMMSQEFFKKNIMLALDAVLLERRTNLGTQRALEKTFGDIPLPQSSEEPNPLDGDEQSKLYHPLLADIDPAILINIYTDTIKELDRTGVEHQLLHDITGNRPDLFLEQCDGIVCGDNGLVRMSILLENGYRMDHEPSKPRDSYISDGEKLAKIMKIEDPYELVLAWLEADEYEMRRCREISDVLTMGLFEAIPAWVRLDTFSFLRQEALKQGLAFMFFSQKNRLGLEFKVPQLHEAMWNSSEGKVDPIIQKLLSDTLVENHKGYAVSAKEFYKIAKDRELQAYKSRFLA